MKELLDISKKHPILLFDGVCNLCNGFVQFVIERDQEGLFKFAALQSDVGKNVLQHINLSTDDLSTAILIEDEKIYTQSTVGLKMIKKMNVWYRFLYFLIVLPKPFRDFFYRILAKNRYKWFGEKENCMIPSPELQSRFL